MKILAIESASLVASVAIAQDDKLIAEYSVNHKKTHSQTLLPMIDEIVRMTDTDLNTLDAIAISGGPGSFTGLRIGSATAKGLALALKIPVVHVPTIDAMAYVMYGFDGLICPMLDAKRAQVYSGLYHFKDEFEIVKPQCAIDLKEFIDEINEIGEPVVFLGDGVDAGYHIIEENIKVPYKLAPAHVNRQRAAAVAVLGQKYFAEGKIVSAENEAPEYLRVSQAEREMAEKRRSMDL
ncbi:MAG: tRNA (adenosine(37)-N6)-threonylcarbamoyltransferase complex dimerization subunit type 1 TsaB [Lachnospiraceae bacterium]|nr:tRNA (adenosine(37)-N6)-threonylcarbamoyltransferase complex dimerization subunit type 1 TsaB [Lachnospiraceae bacterium]